MEPLFKAPQMLYFMEPLFRTSQMLVYTLLWRGRHLKIMYVLYTCEDVDNFFEHSFSEIL